MSNIVQQLSAETTPEIIYPDSDGQPMADNTKQYQWIVKIKENLEIYSPDSNKFLTSVEFDQLAKQERQEKEAAIQQYQKLLTKLQEKGIDLDNL